MLPLELRQVDEELPDELVTEGKKLYFCHVLDRRESVQCGETTKKQEDQ